MRERVERIVVIMVNNRVNILFVSSFAAGQGLESCSRGSPFHHIRLMSHAISIRVLREK